MKVYVLIRDFDDPPAESELIGAYATLSAAKEVPFPDLRGVREYGFPVEITWRSDRPTAWSCGDYRIEEHEVQE